MRVGAVDIGTNTVRMLVRDGHVEIARRVEVVGLGEGVDATGVLSGAAMDRAAAMLGEYGAAIVTASTSSAIMVSMNSATSGADSPWKRVQFTVTRKPRLRAFLITSTHFS